MEPVKKAYRIAVLGNSQLALGFRLSGIVETHQVRGEKETEGSMRELLSRDDIGLIIASSGALGSIRDRRLSAQVAASVLPMIVEVPEYMEEGQPDTLRRLIIRAIGIDINAMKG